MHLKRKRLAKFYLDLLLINTKNVNKLKNLKKPTLIVVSHRPGDDYSDILITLKEVMYNMLHYGNKFAVIQNRGWYTELANILYDVNINSIQE